MDLFNHLCGIFLESDDKLVPVLYVVYRHVLYRDMPGINTGINTGTKDPSTRLV